MPGQRWLIVLGAVFSAIGVGMGAIGAHALPDYLASQQSIKSSEAANSLLDTDPTKIDHIKIEKKLGNFEKGVRYQLFHALAIVVIGLSPLSAQRLGLRIAAYWMAAGILLFSGGIYGTVFTTYPTHWIVPFGGLAFIVGWLWIGLTMVFYAEPMHVNELS